MNEIRRTEFQYFYTPHNEKAFLKSVYEEVWSKEGEKVVQSFVKKLV